MRIVASEVPVSQIILLSIGNVLFGRLFPLPIHESIYALGSQIPEATKTNWAFTSKHQRDFIGINSLAFDLSGAEGRCRIEPSNVNSKPITNALVHFEKKVSNLECSLIFRENQICISV